MRQNLFPKPVLGICAYGSGSGKTTLLTQLIPALNQRGVRVSIIKHAHHQFDVDKPGKDSYRLREAGAVQTLVGSDVRWALMTERQRLPAPATEVSLAELLPQLDPSAVDLVVVEGFKQAEIAKIEIHRPVTGYPLLAPTDNSIMAIASDAELPADCALPRLDLNDPAAIADYILHWMQGQKP